MPPKVVAPGDVGEVRHRQHPGGGDEEAPAVAGAVGSGDVPRPGGVVPHRCGDRGVEPHVAAQIELVDDVVEVALDLRLPGEVLLPLPLVEELLGEEVAVGVALGVEARARVAVPEPGAADPAAGLEQQGGEPRLAGAVQLVDAGDAGADDQHVDVDCRGVHGSSVPRGFLYRPVSLTTRQRTLRRRGAPHGGRAGQDLGARGAVRDRAARPHPQAALLRPGVLRTRGRTALVAHVADGVPARGDPRAARLRGVPVPRPVGDRPAHRRHGRRRVPEHLPPPGREARRGQRDLLGAVPVPVPRLELWARRQEHRGHAAAHLRRAQPGGGRPRPRTGAVRDLGRLRVDQLRCRRAARARVPRARGLDPRRVEARVDARREVVRVPSPGELEARHRGLRRDVPRRADAPAARHPHEVRDPSKTRRSTRRPSSTPTSSTCAR